MCGDFGGFAGTVMLTACVFVQVVGCVALVDRWQAIVLSLGVCGSSRGEVEVACGRSGVEAACW